MTTSPTRRAFAYIRVSEEPDAVFLAAQQAEPARYTEARDMTAREVGS